MPDKSKARFSLDKIKKAWVLHVLEVCGGNRTHAARDLGVGLRTLRNNLARWGIKDEERQAQ